MGRDGIVPVSPEEHTAGPMGEVNRRSRSDPARPGRLLAQTQAGLRGTTFRENAEILLRSEDPHNQDAWNRRTLSMPATVISSTLHDTLGWPDATVISGDARMVVTRLKETSDVPLRSQASLSLNRSLLAAGLVDRIELTIFPVISGQDADQPGPGRCR